MDNQPLISIIVPVYNVEEYLVRCLHSICRQTWTNLEIIVVDDGSTDLSPEIYKVFAREDKRIRLIRQHNQGQSSARNTALKAATGEYIGFVDADDWIEPDMYTCLFDLLQRTDADIAVCSYFTEQKSRTKVHRAVSGEQTFEMPEAMRMLAEDKRIRNYLWDKLYRRSLFTEETLFPEGRWFEDLAVMYRLFYRARRISVSEAAKYHYTIRQGSTMQSRYNAEKEYHLFLAVCEQNEFFLRHHLWNMTPVFVVRRGLRLIDHLLPDPSPRTEEIQNKVMQQIARYNHLRAGEIGWSFALKRLLIQKHPILYRNIYCLYRKLFPSQRHRYGK